MEKSASTKKGKARPVKKGEKGSEEINISKLISYTERPRDGKGKLQQLLLLLANKVVHDLKSTLELGFLLDGRLDCASSTSTSLRASIHPLEFSRSICDRCILPVNILRPRWILSRQLLSSKKKTTTTTTRRRRRTIDYHQHHYHTPPRCFSLRSL